MKMTQQKQRAAVMAMMRDRRVEVREGQQEKERRNLVRHVLRILSTLLRLHLNQRDVDCHVIAVRSSSVSLSTKEPILTFREHFMDVLT